jgi:hypothetical protein
MKKIIALLAVLLSVNMVAYAIESTSSQAAPTQQSVSSENKDAATSAPAASTTAEPANDKDPEANEGAGHQ